MRFTRFQLNFRPTVWAGLALLAVVAGPPQPACAAEEWPSRDITGFADAMAQESSL